MNLPVLPLPVGSGFERKILIPSGLLPLIGMVEAGTCRIPGPAVSWFSIKSNVVLSLPVEWIAQGDILKENEERL